MFTNMEEMDMEVPEASNEVEIKQEPAPWLQPNIPVVPLWALGILECNKCEFRTKYKSVLKDHRDVTHIGVYPTNMKTQQPYIQQQQHSSSIPKWALGGLKCGRCDFTTKYQTILEYHQQKEMHVIMNTSQSWQSPGFQHEIKEYYWQPLIKQREVKHPNQTKLNRFSGKSFAAMTMEAIQTSKKKMATLQEIYAYFEKHYPKKGKKQEATQNQIRHTLSLYKCFYQNDQTTRVKPPPGHGQQPLKRYWHFNPDAAPSILLGKRRYLDPLRPLEGGHRG